MKSVARYWSAGLSVLLGIGVFLFWLLGYPYALTYQEQYQLFLFSSDYFVERISIAGGLSDYLGDFVAQFYYVPWMGALALALLAVAIQQLTMLNGQRSKIEVRGAKTRSTLHAPRSTIQLCRAFAAVTPDGRRERLADLSGGDGHGVAGFAGIQQGEMVLGGAAGAVPLLGGGAYVLALCGAARHSARMEMGMDAGMAARRGVCGVCHGHAAVAARVGAVLHELLPHADADAAAHGYYTADHCACCAAVALQAEQ